MLGYVGYQNGSAGMTTVTGTGSTWQVGPLYVGNSGSGTLSITDGGSVSSGFCGIGHNAGSTGVLQVDGVNSIWKCTWFRVGWFGGSGALSITNGGSVSVDSDADLNTGMIDFGVNGGTLTAQTFYFSSPAQFSGTGTINTRGLVSNTDLVFDSTHGAEQVIRFEQAGQAVMLNLDVTSGQGAEWQPRRRVDGYEFVDDSRRCQS